MNKQEAVDRLIAKVYNSKKKNVLTKNEIKCVEEYYKNNHSGHTTLDQFLQNEDVSKLVNSLKSGKSEIEHQLKEQKALQRGIIAECVFVQSLANLLGFNKFIDLETVSIANIPKEIKQLLEKVQNKAKTGCAARYAYYKAGDVHSVLFQYGNPAAIGDATAFLCDHEIIIEIKDMPALLMDKDLYYDEDGKLLISEEISSYYPDYVTTIDDFNEHTCVFELFGQNYPIFKDASLETIQKFLSTYIGSAECDLLMTSAKDELVVIKRTDLIKPLSDGSLLLSIEGSEIRTTGKNATAQAFTPDYLVKVLSELDITVDDQNMCKVAKDNAKVMGFKQGKGKTEITRYKLSHCFHVKKANITEDQDYYYFSKSKIKQSKSGISIHISLHKTKKQIQDELYKHIVDLYKEK